jgi:ubiquinone/menaquinone biosynthesis C-methylase UbiE
MVRVVKEGGKVIVLEFTLPRMVDEKIVSTLL